MSRPGEGQGRTIETGIVKPKWTEGGAMPRQLLDILEDETIK